MTEMSKVELIEAAEKLLGVVQEVSKFGKMGGDCKISRRESWSA
jgi:hypothetical protein